MVESTAPGLSAAWRVPPAMLLHSVLPLVVVAFSFASRGSRDAFTSVGASDRSALGQHARLKEKITRCLEGVRGGDPTAIGHQSPQDRRAHAEQKCLVEQALLDLPPRHDAVPFPNISAVKMCAAAKPGAPHSMAPACEVASRAQSLLDRYWENSEAIRRLNAQAMHDAVGMTTEEFLSMTVNLDWSRKNPREYPYSQHRKAYDEIAQGVGCAVKCNVAQAGRTPPAGWAHVTQRHKSNDGVKVAKVLNSMEDNWMGVSAEATLLSSYQLIVSFTDRSDAYSSYVSLLLSLSYFPANTRPARELFVFVPVCLYLPPTIAPFPPSRPYLAP